MSTYQQAFAHAAAGMALLAPGGEWLAANPALCRLLGREQAELAGTRAHEALFDAATVRRIGLVLAGTDMRQDIDVDGPDGHAWRMSMARLDSSASGVLLLQLEPDKDAQARAAVARMQDHLVHGISHDLRAPLRGIAGFAARLDETASLAEAGKADVARIRKAAARAEQLVDTLLELLRASRAPMREQEVDMSLLCEWVAGELQDADPPRTARVDVAPGLRACAESTASASRDAGAEPPTVVISRSMRITPRAAARNRTGDGESFPMNRVCMCPSTSVVVT